jgi:hypothetical protein
MPAKVRRVLLLSVAACGFALTGCWHSETPQQKFVDAMNHGNGAQASQIWLNMDAESRADFSHGQGMQPDMSPDEVKKQVMEHYQKEQEAGENGESGANGDETVERPAPMVHLGGLQTLPEYVAPTGAPPQTVTVPTQDAPPN